MPKPAPGPNDVLTSVELNDEIRLAIANLTRLSRLFRNADRNQDAQVIDDVAKQLDHNIVPW